MRGAKICSSKPLYWISPPVLFNPAWLQHIHLFIHLSMWNLRRLGGLMNEGTPSPPSRTLNWMCFSKELCGSFYHSRSLSRTKTQAKNIARSKNISAVTLPDVGKSVIAVQNDKEGLGHGLAVSSHASPLIFWAKELIWEIWGQVCPAKIITKKVRAMS